MWEQVSAVREVEMAGTREALASPSNPMNENQTNAPYSKGRSCSLAHHWVQHPRNERIPDSCEQTILHRPSSHWEWSLSSPPPKVKIKRFCHKKAAQHHPILPSTRSLPELSFHLLSGLIQHHKHHRCHRVSAVLRGLFLRNLPNNYP